MARQEFKTKWTIVQHSAAGYGGNMAFDCGVEERAINTKADEAKVVKAGGLIFEDYMEAVKFEEFANGVTDPNHIGLYPHVKGTFSDKDIDGLKIYIPVRVAVG